MAIEKIPYDDLLKILKKQMNDSGIKKYCKKICHGSCCTISCDTSDKLRKKKMDFRECASKITCVNFICESLLDLFFAFGFIDTEKYSSYKPYSSIVNQVGKYISHYPDYVNAYSIDSKQIKGMIFEVDKTRLFQEKDIENIRNFMDFLMEKKIRVPSCFCTDTQHQLVKNYFNSSQRMEHNLQFYLERLPCRKPIC